MLQSSTRPKSQTKGRLRDTWYLQCSTYLYTVFRLLSPLFNFIVRLPPRLPYYNDSRGSRSAQGGMCDDDQHSRVKWYLDSYNEGG